MAKQVGVFPITGTIGNATFYKHPDDGYLVKQKSCLDKARLLRDPKFRNTLNHAEEFRRATRGATQLRYALAPFMLPVADGKLNGRMNAAFLKMVKTDRAHVFGNRCLGGGCEAVLEGFNFNIKASLSHVLPVEYSSVIDNVTGQMQVDIASFIPRKTLAAAPGATHFKLVSVASSLDFINRGPKRYEQETVLYAIDDQPLPSIRLEHCVPLVAGEVVFLSLAIVFYALPSAIPRGFLSKRKLARLRDGDHLIGYTGAAEVLRVMRVPEGASGPAAEMSSGESMVTQIPDKAVPLVIGGEHSEGIGGIREQPVAGEVGALPG